MASSKSTASPALLLLAMTMMALVLAASARSPSPAPAPSSSSTAAAPAPAPAPSGSCPPGLPDLDLTDTARSLGRNTVLILAPGSLPDLRSIIGRIPHTGLTLCVCVKTNVIIGLPYQCISY